MVVGDYLILLLTTVNIINSTFSGNTALNGGGIRNDGNLNLINSTLSGNNAQASGGGLVNTVDINQTFTIVRATATIKNSTITKNTAGTELASGVANVGDLTVSNSIIAGNTNNDDIRNQFSVNPIQGITTSNGNNLIGNGDGSSFTNGNNGDIVGTSANPIDAKLGNLQNNGGLTQTHALLSGSPAINAGSNSNIAQDTFDIDGDSNTTEIPFEQRGVGFERIIDTTVDIGAYEIVSVVEVSATTADGTYKTGDTVDITVEFAKEVNVNLDSLGGALQLTLETGTNEETGTNVRIATYTSGSGSDILNFSYTVEQGDESLDLDYISNSALQLNSGSIKDNNGSNVDLTLPNPSEIGSLGANKNIIIDTIAPTVTLTSTAAATVNSKFNVTAEFSELVNGFNIDDITLTNATASNLVDNFSNYTFDITPTSTGMVTIDINSAVAQDIAGNDNIAATQITREADLTLPTVSNITASTSTISDSSTSFTLTVEYSEDMDTGVNPSITIENLQNTITFGSGSWGVDSKTYIATYTVTDANEEVAAIDVKVENAQDKVGNIQAAFTKDDLFSIDNKNPNTPSIISFTEDTGAIGDGITSDNTLIISGSAEANSNIEVFQDGNIGTTTTDNSGNWNFDYTNTILVDNSYEFTAVAKDAAGNASDTSTSFNITVDAVNDAPIVKNAIASVTTPQDTAFDFTLPADTFTDSDIGDTLTYSATLEDDSQLPTWLNFANGTFTGTPTNDNLGEINIKVTATDTAGASVSNTFTLKVENANQAPAINDAVFSIKENSLENTVIGIIAANDPDEVLNFALVSGNLDPDKDGKLAFAIDSNTGEIAVNDKDDIDFETTPSFNLQVTATDAGGLSDSANITVNLIDVAPAKFDVNQSQNGIFVLDAGEKTNIKFTLANINASNVNEIGVFVVDENGNIDGLAPGSDGFLKAALNQSQIIFSALSENPNGFAVENIQRIVEVDSNARLQFFMVSNGTTDAALAEIESTGNTNLPIFFSTSENLRVDNLNSEGFTLEWEDSAGGDDFNDIQLNAALTQDNSAKATKLQTKKELIDLRDITDDAAVNVEVYREAAFDNLIGFYKISDINGGIDTNGDGIADINPNDAGYKDAALTNRITGLDLLATENQTTTTVDGILEAGSILAPFIIADGTFDEAINNNAEVYFAFLGANSDKTDHIRLLADNTFGFEDTVNAGDKDFNDAIVKINF